MESVFRGRYLVGLQPTDHRSRLVCHSRDTTWPVALDDRDRRSGTELYGGSLACRLRCECCSGTGIARGRNWTDDGRLLQSVPSP
jgi:hypothetical protein